MGDITNTKAQSFSRLFCHICPSGTYTHGQDYVFTQIQINTTLIAWKDINTHTSTVMGTVWCVILWGGRYVLASNRRLWGGGYGSRNTSYPSGVCDITGIVLVGFLYTIKSNQLSSIMRLLGQVWVGIEDLTTGLQIAKKNGWWRTAKYDVLWMASIWIMW